jgi:NADPH-dependent 7-cyano-7-deazaguanine reductase QueF
MMIDGHKSRILRHCQWQNIHSKFQDDSSDICIYLEIIGCSEVYSLLCRVTGSPAITSLSITYLVTKYTESYLVEV